MSLTKTPELACIKRWVVASLKQELPKWLQQAKLFTEGEDRNTSKMEKHYELRVDGPYTRPIGSSKEFCSYFEVNLLANWTRDESNMFAGENLQGQMLYALQRDFCITRTGNVGKDEADDESLVGTLQLLPADQIKVSAFGMIDSSTEVYQAVAEAHYELYFTLE